MAKTIFTKAPEQKKIFVEREFTAHVEAVWKAWTDPVLLDQWWAPKPWKAITKSMDFKEGGTWLYYMQGPDGTKVYCKLDYKTINATNNFSAIDAFCDENGKPSGDIKSNRWNNVFKKTTNGTQVNIEITFESVDDLNKMVAMGFVEGFTMAHGNLDELLANQK